MTVTPAAANRGACTRDIVAPAENSCDVQACGIGCRGVLDLDLLAAERQLLALRPRGGEEPHTVAGKSRSSSSVRITWPTCPVAPTTPMLTI